MNRDICQKLFLATFILVGFLFSSNNANATTYYVNSNCSSGCDGTTSAKGWTTLANATRASNVPAGSTVEVVAGSGPYYERLTPSTNQDNVTWNFNNTELRGDIDVNQLVADGTHAWNASTDPSHSGEYYLTLSSPQANNFVEDGDMELDDGSWMDWETVSTNEKSDTRSYTGSYSRHVVANAGGIMQRAYGLTSGKTYRFSGWYYLTGSNSMYVYFFNVNRDHFTTRGSWQFFSYDVVVTDTSAGFIFWDGVATEFYVDDVKLEELDEGGNLVTSLNPWGSLLKRESTLVNSAVVGGTWNAFTTKRWTTNKWDWGDFDSLGFSTFYVGWTGGNPTGNSVEILAAIDYYVSVISNGSTGHTINQAKFIGANEVLVYSYEAATFNKSEFKYADEHAISLISGGTSLSNFSVNNSKFIDCGHRGLVVNAGVIADPINVYNSYFYGSHLETLNIAINTVTLNFKNNSNKNALAGSIEWQTTSVLNESNNQFHIDSNSIHGSLSIGFLSNNWSTTAASDLPANFNTASVCDATHVENCGVDPLVDSSGIPLSTSPLIDAGVAISGITSDYLGNSIYGTPDIGAYEYQPPLTVGTDRVDIGAGARIYGDGKFRNVSTTSSNLADLTITPASGSFSTYESADVRPEWLNITNIDYWNKSGNYYKKWTESSSFLGDSSTIHTVGDLKASTYYTVNVDGTRFDTYLSNVSGQITFTYTGGYSTKIFEVSEDTTSPSAFTPSSPANNSSTLNSQPTLSWGASTDSESGLSKYQLYIDSNLDTDNISSSVTSVISASSLSCGSHTWYVKATDNAGNYINSDIFNLSIACGGGSLPTFKNKPVVPTGGFQVIINSFNTFGSVQNINTTSDRIINLNFNANSDVKKMAISLTGDFSDAGQEYYSPSKQLDLCSKMGEFIKSLTCPDGTYTVYVKFYTEHGQASEVFSQKINLTTTNQDNIFTPAQNISTVPRQDIFSVVFVKSLFFGSSSKDVSRLQKLLAIKPEIYPEKLVTGYFGLLTKKAVQKFQLKYDVVKSKFDAGFGVVGPKTRAKLKEVFGFTN